MSRILSDSEVNELPNSSSSEAEGGGESGNPVSKGVSGSPSSPQDAQSAKQPSSAITEKTQAESSEDGAVEADEIQSPEDAKQAETIRQLAKEAGDVRFYHSRHFTNDEDIVIAAGLATLTAIYKIAQTLHCNRKTLMKHIDETPALAQLRDEAMAKRKDMIQEGIDELVRMRHPNVIMWGAEKLLSDVYGKEKEMEEEDDSILVIGEIPASGIAEGDAILAAAEVAPPEVGLTAMLDNRVSEDSAQSPASPQQLSPSPPTPTATHTSAAPQPQPQAPSPTQPSPQPNQPPSTPPPPTTPYSQPPRPQAAPPPQPSWQDSGSSVPPVAMASDLVDDDQFSDGFEGPGGWL